MATVDERVVRMSFDNQQFERGARQTISTLNQLNSAMDFQGSSDALGKLKNDIQSLPLSALQSGVHGVQLEFNALQVAAATVIQRITNSVVNAVQKWNKLLVIDPPTGGLREYELKMGSVQTIMASTGASLQEVNGYLEELNKYADRTIYSFSDMTNNIGKFTNAGVSLDDAVKAIQGISNEAALSGANAQQASHAMYNFAQALSAGAIKLIDWKSIENAQMATVEFKQELLDTALALGTVVKEGDMYVSTTTDLNGHVSEAFTNTTRFNESLSSQWMTTDVLIQTLARYSDETTDLGKRAFAAAQDIKTFSQLMDTLKEAAESGWAVTFELIFGDFEEAKDLWTGVNNIVSEFLNTMSDARNNLLRGGLASGWKNFVNQYVGDADMMQEAIENVCINSEIDIDGLISKFGSFQKALKGDWLTVDILGQALDDVYLQMSKLTEEELANGLVTKEQRDAFVELYQSWKYGGATLDDILNKLQRLSGRENIIEGIHNAFEALMTVLRPVKEALETIFPAPTFEAIYKATQSFKDFTSLLSLSEESMYTLKVAIEFLLLPVNAVVNAVQIAIAWIGVFIALAVRMIDNLLAIPSKAGGLQKVLKDIFGDETYAKMAEAFHNALTNIKNGFIDIVAGVKEFVQNLNLAEKANTIFANLKTLLSPLVDLIGNGIVGALNLLANFNFQQFASTVGKAFTDVSGFVQNVVTRIVEFVKTIGTTKLPEVMTTISDSVQNVVPAFNEIANAFKVTTDKFQGGGDILKYLGGIFDSFVNKLDMLMNGVDMTKIVVVGFGVALTGLGYKAIELIDRISGIAGQIVDTFHEIGESASSMFRSIGAYFDAKRSNMMANNALKIAAAIAIVAGSLFLLAQADPKKLDAALGGLGITLIIVAGAVAGILALVKTMNAADMVPILTGLVPVMTSIAVLVGTIAASMAVLSLIDFDTDFLATWGVFMATITALVVGIGLLGHFVPTLSAGSSIFIALGVSLATMAAAMAVLQLIDAQKLVDAIFPLSLVIALMAGLAAAVGVFRPNLAGAASLTLFALALVEFGGAALLFSVMPWQNVLKGCLEMLPVIGVMALVMAATNLAGRNVALAGVGLLAMATALVVAGQAIKMIAEIDSTTIGKATGAMAAIMAMFSVFTVASALAGPNVARAGVGILALSATILLLQFAISYLGSMDVGALIQGEIAIGALMAIFAMVEIAGSAGSASAPSILALGAVIGILTVSLMLLTLIPTEELLASAISLSAVLVAVAAVLYNLRSLDVKQAVATAILIGTVLAAITVSLTFLNKLDYGGMIVSVLALVSVMLSFAGMIKIMGTVDWKQALVYAGLLGALLLEISLALFALNGLDVATMLATVVALSGLMLAMAGVIAIISKFSVPIQNALVAAGLIGVLLLEVIGALYLLKDFDGADLFSKIEAISLAMYSMVGVVTILSLIGSILGTGGLVGAGVFAGVLAIIAALAAGFGALYQIEGFSELLNSGVEVFQKLGEVIGAFFGGIVGGLIGGALEGIGDSLGNFATQLSLFAVQLMPFIATMQMVDPALLDSVGSIADMILKLTAADLIDGIVSFFGGGEGVLSDFAAELVKFAPGFVEFANIISQANIDPELVQGAAAAGETMATLAEKLPPTGGVLQDWLGEKSLGTFGTRLKEFGEGLAAYYEAITENGPIDFAIIQDSAKAAQMLSDLASGLPSTGGKLQEWFGEKSLDTFGARLESFGTYFVNYANTITGNGGVDKEAIKMSADAAQVMVDLSTGLPSTGGKFQEWFGEKNLKTFGDQLVDFGDAMVRYYNTIKDAKIDSTLVRTSRYAAETLAALYDSLPKTGGAIGAIFGDQDLTTFKEALSGFGEAVVAFYESVAGIDSMSIDPIKKLTQAGGDLVGAILDGINGRIGNIKEAAKKLILEFKAGIVEYKDEGKDKLEEFAKNAISTVKDEFGIDEGSVISSKFREIGKNVINGFITGVADKKADVLQTMRNLATDIETTTEGKLKVNSPSKVFADIGKFVVEGLKKGIDENAGGAVASTATMGKNIVQGIKDALKIKSPSIVMKEEVGVMIVKGIAEGITEDTSAEEAAKKKAQAIKEAFQTELDKIDLKAETRSLDYQLWEALFVSTGDETKDTKLKQEKQMADYEEQLKEQADIVRLMHDNYRTQLKEFGEDSDLTIKASNEWKQAQLDMAEVAQKYLDLKNEMSGVTGTTAEEQRVAAQEFTRAMNEEADTIEFLQKQGYTMEQITESYAKRAGFDMTFSWMNPESDAENTVKSIMDKYLDYGDYDVQLELTFKDSAASGTKSGVASGAAAGAAAGAGAVGDTLSNAASTGTSNGVQEGIDKVKQALGANSEGSATNFFEGWILGAKDKMGGVKDTMVGYAQDILGAFTGKKGLDENSPSKKTEAIGEYAMEGLIIGLQNGMPELQTTLNNSLGPTMTSIFATAFTQGITNATEADEFIEGMTNVSNKIGDSLIANAPIFNDAGMQIGEQIADGMVAGLEYGKSSIIEKATSIALAAIVAACAAMGIDYYIGGTTIGTLGGGAAISGGGASTSSLQPVHSSGQASKLQWTAPTVSLNQASYAAKSTVGDAYSATKSADGQVTTTTYNFNQYNTSPKSLSTSDIYRQTKSGFTYMVNNAQQSYTKGH